ncbi:MAG: MobB mobilization protein [Gammaproteobacteria bacterium]|nr:MobB mobilization protein [Gammaproteobacteria bacterium]
MPFAVVGDEPLDAMISVRMSRAEKQRLVEDADFAGLSVSEYARRRIFRRPIMAATDAAMIKELRRLGGLIKHIHNESKGTYSAEMTAALRAVREYIEELSAKGRAVGDD